MSTACLIKGDLAEAVLLTPAGREPWTAPLTDSSRPGAMIIRDRAAALAEWLAAQPSVRKRLDALVLDVDQSLCVWVRATSTAEPVVAATLAGQREEIAGRMPVHDVEIVASTTAPATPTSGEPIGVTAIWGAFAPARLLIDRLDRRSVRVASVRSLWHALASNDPSPSLAATVAVQPDRLVWAWSEAGELRCGGALLADAQNHPAPAAARLVMDWLSWAASLDAKPATLRLLAPPTWDHSAFTNALTQRWGDLDCAVTTADHPAEAAARISEPRGRVVPSPSTRPVGSLRSLEQRPTLATRRRFQAIAAAMVLAALALAGLSYRLASSSSGWVNRAAELAEGTAERLQQEAPEAAAARIPVQALRGRLRELRDRPDVALPPEPPPIFAVSEFAIEQLAQVPDARLRQLLIDAFDGVELRAALENRSEAILFVETLNTADVPSDMPALRWSLSRSISEQEREVAFIEADLP